MDEVSGGIQWEIMRDCFPPESGSRIKLLTLQPDTLTAEHSKRVLKPT